MRLASRSTRRAALAALSLAGLGCAHVGTPAPFSQAPQASEAPQKRVVYLTGSRLPQVVDPDQPLPNTMSPMRVYTREQLLGTGQPRLAEALNRIDNSVY